MGAGCLAGGEDFTEPDGQHPLFDQVTQGLERCMVGSALTYVEAQGRDSPSGRLDVGAKRCVPAAVTDRPRNNGFPDIRRIDRRVHTLGQVLTDRP